MSTKCIMNGTRWNYKTKWYKYKQICPSWAMLIDYSRIWYVLVSCNTHDKNKQQEHSPPLEGNSCSAGHKITYLLWDPKFPYLIHKSLQLVSTLNQINPIHIISFSFKMYFNCIHPSKLMSSKASLPFKLTDLNSVAFFISLPW